MSIHWTPAMLNEILAKTRNDSSLALLAKRFGELLRASPDGTLDLNQAVEHMDVQKRRLYDIINILEGAGIVEKTGRNGVRWSQRYHEKTEDEEERLSVLHNELGQLDAEERNLDELLEQAKRNFDEMISDPSAAKYAYVTKEDIARISGMENQTILLIKAPPGTEMNIPPPVEQIQIWLKAKQSPIQVTSVRPNVNSKTVILGKQQSTEQEMEQENFDFDFIDEIIASSSEQVQMDTQSSNPISLTPIPQSIENTQGMIIGPDNYMGMNSDYSGRRVDKQSLTTLQTCPSFEQLMGDLLRLQGSVPLKDWPIPGTQSISQSESRKRGEPLTFEGIPHNLWESVPAPTAQPNNPVPVPTEEAMNATYNDLTAFIDNAKQEIFTEDNGLNPLSPLLSEDVYNLARTETEGIRHLF